MTSQNRVDDDLVEFFHTTGELFAITDADYRLEIVSPAFQVLLESTIEELRGSTFFDWIAAEDRPFSEARRQRADAERSAWRSGGKLCGKGGKKHNAWWSWTRSADGLKRFCVVHMLESTATDTQQESSMVRLRSLSQNIPLAVLETDLSASIISWNPAAERIFGFREEEVLGKRPDAFLSVKGDKDHQPDFIEGLLSPPHVVRMKRPIRRKDGEIRLIDWTATLARTDAGEIRGMLMFADDITDKERTLEDLQRHVALIEEQRDKLRALSAPVLQTWEGVLVVPVIGTVDSERAHGIMEALLFAITERRSRFAVLDLTGVENIDAATADHLLKVMGAIRLLGAQGLFCGIRPQVAQILTEIEVDLSSVVTLATLHEALAYCISRLSARES